MVLEKNYYQVIHTVGSLTLNREIANAILRVPVIEGENGRFIWAVWLNLLCTCLSLRSYGCDRL
jgi:hypothetical protein